MILLDLPGADRLWLRVAVLAIGLLMMSRHLTGPFTGKHEFNSAMYTLFARNHLRYGLAYTKGFCTWGEGPTAPAEPHRYLNHPPLIAVWTAGALAVLGEHEWAARLVPIAATLGGAALLMMMASRLASPAVGVLAGVFYATLPITSYFGRMLDHVALVQFFSLLMVHGYLQWSGVYGRRRRVGALWYVLGVVLGIGTGWGTVFAAGLVFLMEVGRRAKGLTRWTEGERERGGEGETGGADANGPLPPLTPSPPHPLIGAARKCPLWALVLTPATTLAAVGLHILWGFEWDTQALVDLFWSRAGDEGAGQSWAGFWRGQWEFVLDNYTWAGVLGVMVWLVAAGWAACAGGRFRQLIDAALGGGFARAVFTLFGLHGLLYVIAFRGPASHHEYWQFFAAPFVAAAMASVIALAYTAIVRWRQRAATAVASLLVAAPMPGFMFARDEYHTAVSQAMPVRYIEPYVRLAGLVPAGSPAMISRDWPVSTERFGQHVNRWGVAQILYYADRPLITTRNLDEILANAAGCSAYVLEVEDDPDLQRLNDVLSARYRSIGVGNHHVIFLLGRPRAPKAGGTPAP